MGEIEAWDVWPVMATCKRRPGVWWRDSKGPCSPHPGSELRILTKGGSSDFFKLESGSRSKIPEKESFRRKVGLELTFLEHRLYTRKKAVCVCFSHVVL